MKGALDGIRILDFCSFRSGSYCGMLLSDMGADVIKVEQKDIGSELRGGFPPYLGDSSLSFESINRNKRGIALDLSSDEGKKIIGKLIENSDVLIEDFKPGTLEKMEFGKDKLNELNPGLIVTSISGFGQFGPYKDKTASNPIILAMSGIMNLTGTQKSGPIAVGFPFMEFLSGTYAAYNTVIALYDKLDCGIGQTIDVSMLDIGISLLASTGKIADNLVNGTIYKGEGNRDPVTTPSNTFKAKGGYVHIAGGTDVFFERFAKIMGKSELLEDELFGTNKERIKNPAAIEKIVGEWTIDKTPTEIESLLSEQGIPCVIVSDIQRIATNPQIEARDLVKYLEYPNGDKIPVTGMVVKFSETPSEIYRRAPMLGEHNEEICLEVLKMTKEKVKELIANKVM